MNTSQFMDKQIMDLSNSQSTNDFLDLEEHHVGDDSGSKKEEILPNYDFQPIRPIGIISSSPPQQNSNHVNQVSSNYDSGSVGVGGGGTRVWNSADSKTNSAIRNYVEPINVISEKDRSIYDAALLSEIDRTMKKHADNLLHSLEGVSARLSQLETRSRHLENAVDDLKVSVGNNYGSTDGKMRQIENILREVQAGVQVVKDKQEILEAQMQLSKLQVSKSEQLLEPQATGPVDPVQQVASAPMQSHQHLPTVAHTQPSPPIFPPNAPPQSQPQNLPPQLPSSHFPQNHQVPPMPQRDPYYLPPGQTPEGSSQQHQPPPQSQQLPPPLPQRDPYFLSPGQTPEGPSHQYQPPPSQQLPPPLPAQPQTQLSSQYQPPPPHLSQPHPSQPPPSVGYHSEEPPPYMPSQSYPPNIRQSNGAPPSQQFYDAPPAMMYEAAPPPPSSNRPGSGFSYGSSYGGPQPQYNVGSPRKSQQYPPNMGPSGGSGYPQLPTARILPQALPTASGVGSDGSGGSGGSGNRVPIDDVVDKVTTMGFSRDQVRATVRKLTENGQAVDLNIVLDKLMNDGVEAGPARGWFGR